MNVIKVHIIDSIIVDSYWVYSVVGKDVAVDAIVVAIVANDDPKILAEDLMDEDGMVVPVEVPVVENIFMVVVEIVYLVDFFVDLL